MNFNKALFSLVLILLIAIYTPTIAQVSENVSIADKHLKMGDSLFKEKNYAESTKLILKALEIYKSNDQVSKIVACYNKITDNKIAQGENAVAKKYIDSIGPILKVNPKIDKETLGKYYFLQAIINHLDGKYDSSINLLERSMKNYSTTELSDNTELARVYRLNGMNYYQIWNHQKALRYFEKALKIFQKYEDENLDSISSCYSYISRIYTRSEQHSMALVYNKKTLTLNQNIYGISHPQTGLAYAIMAITFGRMNDYEKSLENYKKANSIFVPSLGEGHPWVVTTYENIGRAHNRLKNYDASLENYKKAILLGTKYLGSEDLVVAHVFLNAADTYAEIGNNSKALELYGKALHIQKKAFGEKHREVAQNYIAQGDFYKNINDYSSALVQFDKVHKMYLEEISAALDSELIFEEINVFYKIIEALEGKAFVLKQLYLNDGQINHLKESKEAYIIAQALIEKMRLATINYEDKIYITSSNQISLRGIVETSFLLHQEDGNAENLYEAFYYSEKNRARKLQVVAQQSAMNNSDDELKEFLKKEKDIKQEKSVILSKIEETKNNVPKANTSNLSEYEENLFKINLQYNELIEQMRKKFPNYSNVQFDDGSENVTSIQSRLGTNTTLIEYFVADETKVYVFLLTKNNFVAKQLNISELEQKANNFKQSILTQDTKEYKKYATILYQDLIAPIAKDIKGTELVIVPDASIWDIMFELLMEKSELSNNPKNFEYFLRKYTISYANSASLILNRHTTNQEYEKDMLAFSFYDSIQSGKKITLSTLRNRFDDLPGTREEIKEIAKYVNGNYFYGREAEEANFKKEVEKYRILHLALHAVPDNENPHNSRLYFSKGMDTIQDNVLYAHELSNLNISSELVVLSACQTGTGKITTGEGIMSLGNYFQYSGAKSLVISSWEVSDKTTPEIMKLFYRNIKKGLSKSKALQNAKLTYLENADTHKSDPFYWGAFYLVGDTSSMQLEKVNFNSYWLVCFLVIAVLSFLIIRNYRSNNNR